MTTVRKVNLIEFWRVGELESWYHDMHRKGLKLVSASSSFSKFKKVEPEDVLYRIEITVREQIDDEQLHLIEDSGWDYVTSVKQFHVFRAPASRQAPEIHSDPTVHAEAFEKLAATTKRGAIISTLIGTAVLAMFVAFYFSNEAMIYHIFVEVGFATYVPLAVIIFLNVNIWLQFYRMKHIQQQLNDGQPLLHEVPYQRVKWGYVLVMFLILLAYSSVFFNGPLNSKTIAYEESLPIVRLDDIEQDPTLVEAPQLVNSVEYSKSMFVAPQYDSDESLRSETIYYEDGSGIYEPTIWNKYLYVKLPFLRGPLYESMLDYEIYRGEYHFVANDFFDRLEAYQEEGYYQILALKDGHILYVHYFGMEPFASVVAAMEKTIQAID